VLLPKNDPLHKVTIIPRGRALGVTMSLPERDKLSYSKDWCEARLAMMFGGRVAEQLIYGEDQLNTGASNDILQATNLAKSMVTEWGMSEKLGPLRYSENQQEVFLGHSVTQTKNMSEDTARMIDAEVRRIVTDGYNKARELVYSNRDKLEAITAALMEFETISGEETKTVMAGGRIIRKADDDDNRGPAGPTVPTTGQMRPRDETGGAPQPA
jgi:cell division protease FtsH